jgi:AcrR family transcriptional regulator
MGRPSLADVRRPQLLDAYAACLIRYGVKGTSLDRVAEEAGVTRGLVRHYLGNRDEILRALGSHVRDRYVAWVRDSRSRRTGSDPGDTAIDWLLDEQPPELYAVIDALFTEARRDPTIAAVLRDLYQALFEALDGELAAAHPDADPAARRQVALALVSFGFADTDFAAIGFRPRRRQEYRAIAQRLVETLR